MICRRMIVKSQPVERSSLQSFQLEPVHDSAVDALARAWNFETSHDPDGDGINENIAGWGWVESWIPTMPHEEIYLAALDQQASTTFANHARATRHAQLAADAEKRAAHIAQQIETKIHLRVEGAEVLAGSSELRVQFSEGDGSKEKEVKLSW